jgi:transcriptional regulator with XRE-family HTH domain
MAGTAAKKLPRQPPTLEGAIEVSHVVHGLRQFGLTQAEIGVATGAKVRAVRNWERTSATRRRTEDRLHDLREVVLTLQRTLTPRGVGQWLRARNRVLQGRRPLEALAAGDVEAVREAAEAFVEGSYV